MSSAPNSQFYDARAKTPANSSTKQEIQFINGMPSRLLLVIEPSSSEFLIDSGSTVRVTVEHQSTEQAIEIEYLPGGMLVYRPTIDEGLESIDVSSIRCT